jgi:hypothetical protein
MFVRSRFIIPGRAINFEQSGRIRVTALDDDGLGVVVDHGIDMMEGLPESGSAQI